MKPWLREQLDALTVPGAVVDPDWLLQQTDLTDPLVVHDWFALRRAHERGASMIIIQDSEISETRDLPYDIETSRSIVRLRVPAPPEYRRLILDLDDELSERAVSCFREDPTDPLSALLSSLWGITIPARDEAAEIEIIIRLRTDPTVPGSIWPLLTERLRSPIATETSQLQDAWSEYLALGSDSRWASAFERVGVRLGPLFSVGILKPSKVTADGLPDWVKVGAVELSPAERTRSLLDARPAVWPGIDLATWSVCAQWWASVRSNLASVPAPDQLGREAWTSWSELDRAFRPWLRQELGSLMLSAGAPLTVNRIAPFLARRVRSAQASRILLIVLDGMALAQWAVVRDLLNLNVQFASTSLAMVPTLTAVSRQAIFAGRLPADFAESIRTTEREPKRWSDFWSEEGIPPRDIAFHVLLGAEVDEVPSLQAGFPVVGLVVKAIDEMLHGAKLLGDAQLRSAIETWIEHGFLRALLSEANANGYETWITSDHGNLETLPSGRIMEGLMVETAGVRVRWYPDESLRDGRLADGEPWDPPGLPPGIYPLFAPGRSGYFTGRVRVTHGGISLDEVFIPLAKLSS